MRQDETGIRITEDAVLSHNAVGEVLNTYKRPRPTTLYTLRSMGDITVEMYAAGIRYNRLYEAAGMSAKYTLGGYEPQVDGAGAAPGEMRGNVGAQLTLIAIREDALGEKGADMLNDICGEDMTMTDYRKLRRKRWQACSRELNMYLDRLVRWFQNGQK